MHVRKQLDLGVISLQMATMPAIVDPTVPVVKNVLLLDSEGKRIAVKYYSDDWCETLLEVLL